MEPRGLYDFIKYLEHGTHLHVGVLFFGRFGNEHCRMPYDHTIHSKPVCTILKLGGAGFRRCFRCRNLALQKALEEKEPFGGFCPCGVYEYTYPVRIGTEVAAVIFIGNLCVDEASEQKLRRRLGKEAHLLHTMEHTLTPADLTVIAELVAERIRYLLSLPPTTLDEKKEPLIENVKSYIREGAASDISTAQLASVFHYNKTYLGRVFKQAVGLSIAEYLRTLRLERACVLLKESAVSVTQIAEDCGFASVSYFNRIFKSAKGISPSEYRKICKNANKSYKKQNAD